MKKIIGVGLLLASLFSTAEDEYCLDGTSKLSRTSDEFIILKDKGLVIDRRTHLMWKRCIEGTSGIDCSLNEKLDAVGGINSILITHQSAMDKASGSTFAGYDDWVVPNYKQVTSVSSSHCLQSIDTGNGRFIGAFFSLNSKVFPIPQELLVYMKDRGKNYSLNIWPSTPQYGSGVSVENRIQMLPPLFGADQDNLRDSRNIFLMVRALNTDDMKTLLAGKD